MLSLRNFVPLRRFVAVICMTLAVMLSGQAYISLMDRIDHAHHHVHFANPLAGDVQFSPARQDHDAAGHHEHRATQDVAEDRAHGSDGHHRGGQDVAGHHTHGTGDHHPHNPVDHQHGDATVVFLAVQSFVFAACPAAADRCATELPILTSVFLLGPDHPPKSDLEFRV